MKLYRYLTCSDTSINNIENDQFYLSPSEKFNDPFEFIFKLQVRKISTEEEAIEAIESYLLPFFDNIASTAPESQRKLELEQSEISSLLVRIKNKDLRSYKPLNDKIYELARNIADDTSSYSSKIGITCFSRKQDTPHMWMYYADGMKGFCIEYEFPDEQLGVLFHRVKYVGANNQPTLTFPQKIEYLTRDLVNILTTKHSRNSVETEVRLVLDTSIGELGRIYKYCPKDVKSVIFGECIDPSKKLQLLKVFTGPKYEHVSYRNATRKIEDYGVHIINLGK